MDLNYTTKVERQEECKALLAEFFPQCNNRISSRDGFGEAYVFASVYPVGYVKGSFPDFVKAKYPWFKGDLKTDENPWKYLDEEDYYVKKGKQAEYEQMRKQQAIDIAQWRINNPEEAAKRDADLRAPYTKYDGIGTNGSDRYYA